MSEAPASPNHDGGGGGKELQLRMMSRCSEKVETLMSGINNLSFAC